MVDGGADTYRVLFERSADASLIIDGDRFVDCNQAAVDMLQCRSRDEVLQLHPSDLSPEFQPDGEPSYAKANELMAIAFARGSHRFEWDHQRPNGEVFPVEVLLTAVPLGDRQVLFVVWRDITERKRAERERTQLVQQLHQAQKMDAIGQLAGGIAHDFNNILTAILGNVELQLARYERGTVTAEAFAECLREIGQGAERAASLTRQLLAFSRQQISQPQVLDLKRTMQDLEGLFRRLLAEDIALAVRVADEVQNVRMDPAQLEQVVVNLVVNARDAMPDGGRLSLTLANTHLDASYVEQFAEARTGPHVVLTVSDTGTGMEAATLQRIFEPFFTTKEIGRGTGLGLATVYGVVKQAGGHVTVYSEPGHGSVFRVYLPACDDAPQVAALHEEPVEETPAGQGTILVSEDDPAVRRLAADILRQGGYTVLEAQDGAAALRRAEQSEARIDLLVTDVIMPDMNGRQVADALHARDADVRVLYMSGYTNDVIAHRGVLDDGVAFIEKPFSRRSLLHRVAQILELRQPSADDVQGGS